MVFLCGKDFWLEIFQRWRFFLKIYVYIFSLILVIIGSTCAWHGPFLCPINTSWGGGVAMTCIGMDIIMTTLACHIMYKFMEPKINPQKFEKKKKKEQESLKKNKDIQEQKTNHLIAFFQWIQHPFNLHLFIALFIIFTGIPLIIIIASTDLKFIGMFGLLVIINTVNGVFAVIALITWPPRIKYLCDTIYTYWTADNKQTKKDMISRIPELICLHVNCLAEFAVSGILYAGLGPIPPIFVCLGLCVLSGAFAVIFMNNRIKKEMKRNLESTTPADIELATTTDNTTNTNTTNSND